MKLLLTLSLFLILSTAHATEAVKDCTHANRWMFAFCSSAKGRVQLTIADTTGTIIFTAKVKVFKGLNASTFYASRLQPGIYNITIADIYSTTITVTK